MTGLIGTALARSQFRPADVHAGGARPVPAVFVVDAADRVVQLTASAESAVAELGGWDCCTCPGTPCRTTSRRSSARSG